MGANQQVLASLGSSFSPLQISGLGLWLKADVDTFQTVGGAAAVADGDPVGEWRDQSGFGNHATQATSTKRFTRKTGANGQNGRAVVRADGVDDFLLTPSMATFPAKRGTLFVVSKNVTTVGNRSVIGTYNGVTPNWKLIASNSASFKPVSWYDNASTDRIEASSEPSMVWNIHSVSRTSDTNLSYRRNGIAQIGRTINNNQPAIGAVAIGADVDGVDAADIQIGEILLYGVAMTAGQILEVEAYLNSAARWLVF